MNLPRFSLLALLLATFTLHAAEAPLIIADFEDGAAPFERSEGPATEVVAEHAAHGQKALKLKAGQWVRATPQSGMPTDWSKYDVLKFECFNAGTDNAQVTVQIRDPLDKGYWTWHNRYIALAPGANTIQIPVSDLWRGEVLRNDIPGDLNPKNITVLTIIADHEAFLDHVRLEAFQVPKVIVPGLKAFKVGPAKSPGFPGFTKVSDKDQYAKDKGFGWLKSQFGRMDDRLHPDNLFRSYISACDAELAVDLPNGKYRVHLQLEDPGYWEFMQNYHERHVLAEGKDVISEKMDGAEFTRRYFLNQDAEDAPGEDPFDKYVEPRFPWHTFDVDVADGQLNLAFKSQDTYGNTLSAVVIYPVEQADAGKQFLSYVKELRRFDWSQRWKPVSKPATEAKFAGAAATEDSRDGFALYTVSSDDSAESTYIEYPYDHTPVDAELIAKLELTACAGETTPICFGLRPAKPLGKVDVKVSALKNAAGAELAAENVAVWVGRYRFSRYHGAQTGLYAVTERELRPFNRTEADVLRVDNGMARRFWINVTVPEGTAAGTYSGTIAVKAEKGGERAVPFTINVLPVTLPAPGHLFSLYGIELMPPAYFPEMKADRPRQIQALYKDLRAHGINFIRELSVDASLKDGKAVIKNADAIDAEIALRKKLGFEMGPVYAPSGCTLDQLASGAPVNGLPREKFIEGWHAELTRAYQAHGWPKPFFCYGDEPNVPETLNKLTAINKAVHAAAPDAWMGIAYHVESPESYELLKTLDVQDFKAFCKVDDFKKAKAAGKFLLNCNVGENRAAYGLREWRAMHERATDGCITYAYTGNHIDIYYDLDGREDDRMMAPPRRDGTFVTTARWERIREGIDDFRYARALDQFVATAPTEQGRAATNLINEAYEIGGIQDMKQAIARTREWRAAAQKLLAQKSQQ